MAFLNVAPLQLGNEAASSHKAEPSRPPAAGFRHDPRRLLPDLTAIYAEHVDDIMRRRVVTVAPDDPVTAAADRMLASRLHSLPVVERQSGKDRVIGIVSRGDVLKALTFEADDAE